MGKTTLFIYGTLRDDALREAVLGRPTPLRPATLPDHRVMRVAGETFPMVVPSPGNLLEGALIELDEDAFTRFIRYIDFFSSLGHIDIT